ncbi:MAG: LysR family transcriptional regulator [Streptosporangiaceae bacterium]|jgi:DNA-binding transcriptional LysR family regulator
MAEEAGFTLVQLRYFVAAAESGSMTAAAERLVIAQSAISAAVSNLEKELRAQLFIRRRARGLTLTPAGERFLQQARDVLNHVNEVAEEARGTGGDLKGPVTFGCFVTLAPLHLPPLLTAFADAHPEVEVGVFEAEADEIAAALRGGRIDFALAYDLGFDTDDIEREKLASAPAHVIVPVGHRLAGRGAVDLAALDGDPMILLDLPHSRDYFWSVVTAAGLSPVVRYRTRSYETVRSLVAQGHGFSVLNQVPLTGQTYSGGEVAALDIKGSHPPLDVVLVRLAGVRQTARSSALAAIARRVVADTAQRHRIDAHREKR